MKLTTIAGRALIAIMLTLAVGAGAAGGIAAKAVGGNEVPELATDPRMGWVILPGPEEGETHAAICSEGDLQNVGMNFAGWVFTWRVFDDPMCVQDAPWANLDPMRFQDPRFSWVIIPSESGQTFPARCYDADFHSIDDTSGALKWVKYKSAPACDPAFYKA